MSDKNKEIRDHVIACFKKGINPKQTAEFLQSKGYTRPSDGKAITRKDINNRLLGLRNAGLIPPLKTSTKKATNKGVTMTTITIDQVKETTGMSQAKIAKKIKVNPTSIVQWKKEGIPDRYMPKFEKLMGTSSSTTPTITKTTPKKRKYNRKAPVLKQVTPEEIGVETTASTVFVVTKDKAVINDLISRFL